VTKILDVYLTNSGHNFDLFALKFRAKLTSE